MRKKIILFTGFILTTLLTSTANAAIFANDSFYLYIDGKPVSDNSVLINATRCLETLPLNVCKGGRLYIRQNHSFPLSLVFIKTSHDNIMTYNVWSGTEEGRKSQDQRHDYQNYLHLMAADAVIYRRVFVQSPRDEPPLEESPRMPIKEGMTGGLVGSDRYFRVDLDKDIPIIQIKRSDAPLGYVIYTETKEDGTTCAKGVSSN